MAAQSGQSGPFRFQEAPIATPIAIPTASQTPTFPAITPKTAPSAAPSAIPSPPYLGLTFITHSYADFASCVSELQIPRPRLAAGRTRRRPTQALRFRQLRRFWALVADRSYLAQQFRHWHAG